MISASGSLELRCLRVAYQTYLEVEQTMIFKTRQVETSTVELHVREIGDGRPILFFHGITANSSVFDPITSILCDQFRCISVDQRGHGRSAKPQTGYSAKDFVEDTVSLINALGLHRPIIVGHSLGARNSIEVAAAYPELIAGVVAIDFTPYIEYDVLDSLAARVNGGDRAFSSQNEIRSYLHERYPLMPADAIERRTVYGYVETPDGWRPLASGRAMAQIAQGLREDLAPATSAVKVPTLLVRGALSKLVSEAAFEKTRSLRPDLPTLVVEGVDHYVPEEAPAAIIMAVRNFSAQVDANG